MTLSDYVLDLALIGLVLLQIRGRKLDYRMLLIPVLIVGYVCSKYLHGIPTYGNALPFIIGCAVIGAALGTGCAVFTSVTRRDDGNVYSKAGVVAAVLWVLGVGARFAFQLYANTTNGGNAVGRFTFNHHLANTVSGVNAVWAAALILMAIGEVVFRSGGIVIKAQMLNKGSGATSAFSPTAGPAMSNGGASY